MSFSRLHSEIASIVKQSLEIFSLSDYCSSHLSLNEHLMWAPNILFNCSLLKIWHWHIIKFLTEFKLQHNEGFFLRNAIIHLFHSLIYYLWSVSFIRAMHPSKMIWMKHFESYANEAPLCCQLKQTTCFKLSCAALKKSTH